MYTVRKQLKWEGAHRLQSSYTKECQRLHGHSYKCEVVVESDGLDADGMVIDFKHIKDVTKELIDLLDHRTMLCSKDKPLFEAYEKEHPGDIIWVHFNPTAEHMARWIWKQVSRSIIKLMQTDAENPRKVVVSVCISETCTGKAEYRSEVHVPAK